MQGRVRCKRDHCSLSRNPIYVRIKIVAKSRRQELPRWPRRHEREPVQKTRLVPAYGRVGLGTTDCEPGPDNRFLGFANVYGRDSCIREKEMSALSSTWVGTDLMLKKTSPGARQPQINSPFTAADSMEILRSCPAASREPKALRSQAAASCRPLASRVSRRLRRRPTRRFPLPQVFPAAS